MAYFPHKEKGDPATSEEFLQYSLECGKQHDYLAALFYCYWALEVIKNNREKLQKKEHIKVDDLAAKFVTRATELRFRFNQHPIASMMKNPEIEVMQRRIQDIRSQILETSALVPSSDDEAGKLGLKLKALAEEGSFLNELFSPLNQIEGPEVWQERLTKGVENLFTNLSRVQAVTAAEAAEARRKAEIEAAEVRMKEEAEAAEIRQKSETQAIEAEAAETRKKFETLQKLEIEKSKHVKKLRDDLKIEDPPATL